MHDVSHEHLEVAVQADAQLTGYFLLFSSMLSFCLLSNPSGLGLYGSISTY